MRWESEDFLGITPAVDARKSDKLFALAGRNYVLDALGPKSPFGNRFLTPYPLGIPEHSQGCRLRLRTGDRVFLFAGDAIIEWIESTGTWRYIYVTGNTTIQPYRWTFGYINGIMYFCNPSIGILAYEVEADFCEPLTSPGTPVEPIAIIVNNGRLIVIDDLYYTWSAPGDGTNFTPTLGGAGQQKIADRVPGFPIMLSGYARGVMTWTTGGVMRSEFTGDVEVYRHRAINTEYRPINSFCTFQMDDNTVAILDERGIFQSTGEAPRPLTPLFNEFLIDYLQKYDLKLGQNVRLEFDDLRRWLFLSLSLSESSPIYEKAFVLYPSLDKWGTFDEEHLGVVPVLVKESTRADDYFGFVGTDGRIRYWDFVGSRELFPTDGTLNSVYPIASEKPAHIQVGNQFVTLSSSAVVNTVPMTPYSQGARGFYPAVGYSPAESLVTDLDSVLQMGFIRARGEDSNDQLIEINQIFVGSALSGNPDQVSVDFNLIPPTIPTPDVEDIIDAENFAVDNINYVNHGMRIIATVDGLSPYADAIPELIRFDKGGRYFSCSIVGLWNILELSATEIGEAYHLRTLEMTAVDAGRLN